MRFRTSISRDGRWRLLLLRAAGRLPKAPALAAHLQSCGEMNALQAEDRANARGNSQSGVSSPEPAVLFEGA